MLCTPVAVVNDTPSAPDDSLRPDWGKLTSSTGQAADEADGQPEGDVEVPMPGRAPGCLQPMHTPWNTLQMTHPAKHKP